MWNLSKPLARGCTKGWEGQSCLDFAVPVALITFFDNSYLFEVSVWNFSSIA